MPKTNDLPSISRKVIQMSWNWILAVLFLIFGIVTIDPDSLKWSITTILFYAFPLGCQAFKNPIIRFGALWLGVFMIFQTLLTPYIHYHIEYRTLQANINTENKTEGVIQKITTDDMGFRVYPRIDYNDKKGFRIFALGGSTTEQILLDDQKTWPHLVQLELTNRFQRKFEVINTGVSGTRARNHFAKLKKLIQYKPDMVVILAGINDWNKQIADSVRVHYMEPYFLRKSLLAKAIKAVDVFFWGPLKDKLFDSQGNGVKKTTLENKAKEMGETKKKDSLNRQHKFSWKPKKVAEEFKLYMEKIQKTCSENKIPCVFLTQPSGYQETASPDYKSLFWMTPPFANYTLDFKSMIYLSRLYNNYIRDFAGRYKVPICDIAKDLSPSPSIFYDDCHFTLEGSHAVAKLISPCLEKFLESKKLIVESDI
jgi:hypothetical protein